MLKLLKVFMFFFASLGCIAVVFVGFEIFLFTQGRGLFAPPGGKATATAVKKEEKSAVPISPEMAAIVQDYKKSDEAAEAAASSTGTVGMAGMPTTSRGGLVMIPKAMHTPDPAVHPLIREWPMGHKWVALTFDDGPHPTFTPQFMQLLHDKNVKATFFLIGPNVEKNPEIVQSLVANGFEIGNHTKTHRTLSNLKPDEVRAELVYTNDAIKAATGLDMNLMRPPYGSANKKVQDICKELGLKIICWSIDTEDWKTPTTEQQMEANVMKNVRDGAIILMHDRYEKSLKTTAYVIDEIRKQGYEFVTVSELMGLPPQTAPAAASSQTTAPVSNQVTAPMPSPAMVSAPSAPIAATPAAAGGATPTSELPAVSSRKVTQAPPRTAATPKRK